MKGYTKLFQDIVTSTIWREPDTTRIVWITLLALSGEDGVVSASVPGLAAIAGVSMEKTLEALDKLKEPDKWSRTKDHEGRRIEETDGGWKILNHGKYRAKMNYEDRKVYLAEKQKEYREREKKKGLAKVTSTAGGRAYQKSYQNGEVDEHGLPVAKAENNTADDAWQPGGFED